MSEFKELETKLLKKLIFQYMKQHSKVINWIGANYADYTVDMLIAELGDDSPSEDASFPAIRYAVQSNHPETKGRFDNQRTVIFDIFIASYKDETDELDELMDLFRSIFTENEGRSVGIFTESPIWEEVVQSPNIKLLVWTVKELASGTPSQGNFTAANYRGEEQGMIKERLGYIRFEMIIAQDN